MNKKGAPDWTSASDDDDGDVVDDAAAKASTMAPMAMCEVDRQGRDRVEDSGRAFKTSACGALPSIASGMLMAAVAVCLSAEVPLLTFAREGDDAFLSLGAVKAVAPCRARSVVVTNIKGAVGEEWSFIVRLYEVRESCSSVFRDSVTASSQRTLLVPKILFLSSSSSSIHLVLYQNHLFFK